MQNISADHSVYNIQWFDEDVPTLFHLCRPHWIDSAISLIFCQVLRCLEQTK